MSTILLCLVLLPAQNQDQDAPRDDTKPAPSAQQRRTDTVLEWNRHALDAIRRDRTPPPLAARNLAILHAAIFDSVNPIYQSHKPYLINLRATEVIDPHVAAACAAHRVLVSLYPKQKTRLNLLLQVDLAVVEKGKPKSRGITLGRYVADQILDARSKDTKTSAVYRAKQAIGVWRPIDRTPPLLPGWGAVRPFGVKNTRDFRPPAPPVLTSDAYGDELNEVKDLGSRNSKKRTAEQSIIAWFWNDGPGTSTPPGHWNQIAQVVSVDKDLTIEENARLFALLNIALADAAIVCWRSKYSYRLWRPITAIREADRDNNQTTQRDAKWEPLLPTPPFPSYTSGHSTFSGAAATILEKFFGNDDIEFTVASDGYPGMRRAYKSFSEAALEAGKSRIYGGIHFQCDNREGLALGHAVALEVFRSRLQKDQ